MHNDHSSCKVYIDNNCCCPSSCSGRPCYVKNDHEPCDFRHEHFKHFHPCPGESTAETQARLYGAMNAMRNEFRKAICQADGLISQLQNKSIYNGAYYDGDVTVNEGWSSEDNTAFVITRIPCRDKRSKRIAVKLHLPYGDTTNSGLEQGAFDASEFLLADKLWTAQVGAAPQRWDGHVIVDGRPCPSNKDDNKYTVGFCSRGMLRWYRNTVASGQLNRDGIVDSFGCEGIIVNNKAVTPTDQWGAEGGVVPAAKTARICMGQNLNTKDIYILSVGSYDLDHGIENGKEYGMTLATAAKIMEGYCDVAVSLAHGSGDTGCASLDKGEMMFMPHGIKPQKNLAYWYISRKSEYSNNYTFESATLRQLYGQLKWRKMMHEATIQRILDRLTDLEDFRDNQLELNILIKGMIEAIEADIVIIKGRLDVLEGDVATLKQKVAALEAWRVQVDKILADHESRITSNTNRIKVLEDWRLVVDTKIAELEALIANYGQRIKSLEDWRPTVDLRLNSLEKALAVLDKTVQGIAATQAEMLLDIEKLKQSVVKLQEDVANLRIDLNALKTDYDAFKAQTLSRLTTIENKLTSIDGNLQSFIQWTQGEINRLDAKNTAQDELISRALGEINTLINTTLKAFFLEWEGFKTQYNKWKEETDAHQAVQDGRLNAHDDLFTRALGDINTLQNNLTNSVNNIYNELSGIKTRLDTHDSKLDSLMQRASTWDSRLAAIDAHQIVQDNRIQALEDSKGGGNSGEQNGITYIDLGGGMFLLDLSGVKFTFPGPYGADSNVIITGNGTKFEVIPGAVVMGMTNTNTMTGWKVVSNNSAQNSRIQLKSITYQCNAGDSVTCYGTVMAKLV